MSSLAPLPSNSTSEEDPPMNSKKPSSSSSSPIPHPPSALEVPLSYKPSSVTFLDKLVISRQEEEEVTCPVCHTERSPSEMLIHNDGFLVELEPHTFCFPCFKCYVIDEGKYPASCPKCHRGLVDQTYWKHLSQSQKDLMNMLQEESAIPPKNRVYCPYKDCSALHTKEEAMWTMGELHIFEYDASSMVECKKCRRYFCMNCKSPWHDTMSCAEFKQSLIAEVMELEDAMFFKLAKKELWTQCDDCGWMLDQFEGCSTIICRCGNKFKNPNFKDISLRYKESGPSHSKSEEEPPVESNKPSASSSSHVPEPEEKEVTCPVCMIERSPSEMLIHNDRSLLELEPHTFCFHCFKSTVIDDGEYPAFCASCHRGLIDEAYWKHLSPSQEELMRMLKEEYAILPEDRVYCPYRECSALHSREDAGLTPEELSSFDYDISGMTECRKCKQYFCMNCKVPWHSMMSCAEYKQSSSAKLMESEDLEFFRLAEKEPWIRCGDCGRMIDYTGYCISTIKCRCGNRIDNPNSQAALALRGRVNSLPSYRD